jgi:hypothetical protein
VPSYPPTVTSNRPFIQQPPFRYKYPLLFCHPDRSEPGFPATQRETKPRMRLSFKERRMKSANAVKTHRKSEVAQGRDLRCAIRVPHIYRRPPLSLEDSATARMPSGTCVAVFFVLSELRVLPVFVSACTEVINTVKNHLTAFSSQPRLFSRGCLSGAQF